MDMDMVMYKSFDYEDYVKWTFIKLKKDFIDASSSAILPEVIQPLDNLIQSLKPNITNLDFFFECVARWCVLSNNPQLSRLTLDIGNYFEKLWSEMSILDTKTFPLIPPACWCLFMCFSSEAKTKRKLDYILDRASQWYDLLSRAYASLRGFTAEIDNCFTLYGCPFPFEVQYQVGDEYRFPHFTTKLESCLNSINCISFPDLAMQISAFTENLRKIVNVKYLTGRPHLLMLIQEVCVEAGLLFCKYNIDRTIIFGLSMANDMTDSFSRLNSRIDITGSHFLDISVKFLNREMPQNELAEFLLQINCPVVFAKNHALYGDLMSLMTILSRIPQHEFPEDLENFSLRVKKVIHEVGSVQEHVLQEHEIDLHKEIWFLKADITIFFYQKHYNTVANSFLLHDSIRERTKFMSTDVDNENMKRIVTLQREVFNATEYLYQSFRSQNISIDMARVSFHRLLLKIVLFRAESFLVKLLKKDERLMAKTTRHQMNSLLQGLRFLTMMVCYVPDDKLMNSETVFLSIESVARKVIPLQCSFITVRITEESELLLYDLVDEIRNIRIQLKDMSMFKLKLNFPKTNGLGFIDFLLIKLKEYLQSSLSAFEEHVIKEILCSLKDIRPLLNFTQEQTVKAQESDKLLTLLIDAAYETELVIDSIGFALDGNCRKCWIHLYHIMDDIKLFNLKLSKIYENKEYRVEAGQEITGHDSSFILLKDNIPTVEEGVSLNDQEEEIIDQLIGGPLRQDIVSLMGMPGIGKTTLARRVYNDRKLIYHFHVRVWCYVSQQYNNILDKKRLLLEILSHIVGSNVVKLSEMTVEDLESKLRQQLLKKRYLVVLDDIWHIEAWNDLGRSFPDDGNGSRILMTSRLNDLGLKANPSSYCHPVRLMSVDESWNLLRMKIFDDEGFFFSKEFMVLGKQIASNCKGLPLAVVAIAGILGRIEKTYESWKKVAESLSSMVIDDPQTRCRDILELSYNHLPDYLKSCFLYFGAFFEQNDIPVSKLICLWIAEGFIQNTGPNLLEDVGEAYLMDLGRRSLVITSEERSIGGIKSCRVHDLLRDLCLSKSKEENFLRSISMYDEVDISCDGLNYGVGMSASRSPEDIIYDAHRICIFSKRKEFVLLEPSGPYVRSLLLIADSDKNPTCPYNISFVFHHFKLLRVLDLECINLGSVFPDRIVLLKHLRYLGVCGNINSVPSFVKALKNLETFIVKGLVGKVELPLTIWSLSKLRHLHMNNHAVFSTTSEDDDMECVSKKLDNLVTLSSLLITYWEDIQTILTSRFPNIRRLKCIISGSQRHLRSHKSATRFDCLSKSYNHSH